jgi:septal ring factor EnvC (AmiA/AmiB activator)
MTLTIPQEKETTMSAIPAQSELLPEATSGFDKIEDNLAAADLVAKVDENPSLVLLGDVGITAYTAALRASVVMPDADINTTKGRDAIKSAAQALRSKKAAIDKRRLSLTEGYRAKVAAINEVGSAIKTEMEMLIEQVRAPVTAWEEAEKARIAEADRILAEIENAKLIPYGITSDQAQQVLDRIRGMNLNAEVLGVRIEMAEDLKAEAVKVLTEAVAGLKAQEQQAAELAQLRAEQAAAEERRLREQQEARAKEEAEARAKAEQERIERAKVEAAEQARRDAEAAAERERIERERAAQAEIDAANARAAEAERAAAAERQRLADLEAAQKAAADADAQEKARREADLAHREQVIEAAADALTALGLTKKLATAVVNAIAAGGVPNVEVRF